MNKKKIVFFLGNGFSRGLGFPSMAQWWDICLTSKNYYYKQLIKEAQNKYPLSYFMGDKLKDVKDIELLLTIWEAYSDSYEKYIKNANKENSRKGDFKDYIENFCMWIADYTQNAIERCPAFTAFSGWIKEISLKYELIFVTTNYDLLIEEVFRYHSLTPCFIGQKPNTIPLRKLHGSITWFSANQQLATRSVVGNCPIFERENAYVHDFSKECLTNIKNLYNNVASSYFQLSLPLEITQVTPIITLIPPVIGKNYPVLFQEIINSTQEDFKNIDYFIMIGYSFPESDPIISHEIPRIYHNCHHHVRPVCINKNKKACRKFKELFGNNAEIIKEDWNVATLKSIIATDERT